MPLPTIEDYCCSRDVFLTFENKVLYQMCRDKPMHDDAWVTAGKILTIGRVYSASPERGAGKARDKSTSLFEHIGNKLAASNIDARIKGINFDDRITTQSVLTKVCEAHSDLVRLIRSAATQWNGGSVSPKKQHSFASKYLHFHRPNAFPLMDSIAKKGLKTAKVKGASSGCYRRYCLAVLEYSAKFDEEWYPRKIDAELLKLGKS